MSLVVIKVGGSLYDLADLGPRLQRLLDQLAGANVVLFPGGGASADVVRDWHRRFELSEDAAHLLAIESLQMNAELLKQLLPGCRLVRDEQLARAHWQPRSGPVILAPKQELLHLEQQQPAEAPPHTWDVTSDSLAAWVALSWQADALVMVKSVPHPGAEPVTAAVRRGLVDPYFPGLAGRLPRVDWCDLRADTVAVTPWLLNGAACESR